MLHLFRQTHAFIKSFKLFANESGTTYENCQGELVEPGLIA